MKSAQIPIDFELANKQRVTSLFNRCLQIAEANGLTVKPAFLLQKEITGLVPGEINIWKDKEEVMVSLWRTGTTIHQRKPKPNGYIDTYRVRYYRGEHPIYSEADFMAILKVWQEIETD